MSPHRLVHELGVYHGELTLQNEHLQQTQLELEHSLRRYNDLFQFAPMGYAVLDASGVIREANAEFGRVLSLPRHLYVGRRFAAFVDGEQRSEFTVFLGRLLTANEGEQSAAPAELELALEGTTRRDVRLVASRHIGADPRALIAIEDMTPRRRAETALREEATRKDAFLATLSHELRNPLFPIRTGLTLLERKLGPQPDEIRRVMAIVARQADHLVRIVDDLLDVTRISHGKLLLQRTVLDLSGLVKQTTEDHRAAFDARGVGLQCHAQAGPAWVDADGARLVQVLGNLLSNALTFTPQGGRVDVTLQRAGKLALLTVADTGVGLDPGLREHLFEPFVPGAQRIERAQGGLGLGLAVVKGTVELHGGTVQAGRGDDGKGAVFTVRLPLAPTPAARPPEPAAEKPAVPRRVLVVEDNADSADAMQALLAQEHHQTEVAHDGPSALAVARKFRPEIVLCDLGLPGMDGYAVAGAMRADVRLRGAYLVALSGYARPEDRKRSADAGFDCHLAKPASSEALEHILATATPR